MYFQIQSFIDIIAGNKKALNGIKLLETIIPTEIVNPTAIHISAYEVVARITLPHYLIKDEYYLI